MLPEAKDEKGSDAGNWITEPKFITGTDVKPTG
jgi:hypothetical protein